MRYATRVSQFRADATLIGKIFNLNGVSHTLVGIMAPRFAWGGVEMWLPRSPDAVEVSPDGRFRRYWGMVARLRPGVSRQEAEADLGGRVTGGYSRKRPASLSGAATHSRST